MNRTSKFLFLVLSSLLVFISGCTTQSWYEGVKRGAEANCNNQLGQARQECLEKLNKQSYENYEKERKAK